MNQSEYAIIPSMRNLIFDIDGTLWNTTGIVAEAWQQAVNEYGKTKAVITAERLKQEFGKTMDIIAEDLFPDIPSNNERNELIDLCCRYEHERLGEIDKKTADGIMFPGVKNTLFKLSGRNRLFIVSNCQNGYIELFTEKSGTENIIEDHLCFGVTGTCKGETILTLMERNKLDPSDTYYIGDTIGDFEACELAGIRFVFCKYGFGEVSTPYMSIGSFCELDDLF